MATIDDARRVKQRAAKLAADVAEVTGVGLTKVDGDYAVKVNVERETAAVRRLPKLIDGVQVVYAATGAIRPRSES